MKGPDIAFETQSSVINITSQFKGEFVRICNNIKNKISADTTSDLVY
jgi:hypothetical protein